MTHDGRIRFLVPVVTGGPRVLLAEDDQISARIAQEVLSRINCHVTVVEDGVAALDAAKQHEFDVLLMDMQMPRMGGLEATRRIATLERSLGRRHVPVVAVTACAMPSEVQQCFDAGIEDVLIKPYMVEDLQRMVLCAIE